jgi:hypothetical protein
LPNLCKVCREWIGTVVSDERGGLEEFREENWVGAGGRGGGNLHVAPLEGLAQALAKFGKEGRKSHAEGDDHKQEAD